MKLSKKVNMHLGGGDPIYKLYLSSPKFSYAIPLPMRRQTIKRIKIIKFAIGVLLGVTIYLFIQLIF